MCGERIGCLDARVWIMNADGLVLAGERLGKKGGSLKIIWHVAPETIRGVMWIEIMAGEVNPASAS